MNINIPNLIILVGLPSSGKTTFSNDLTGYEIHSFDNLRIELFGNGNYQDGNSELFEELHKRLINDLKNDKDVVLDATNVSYKTRMSLLNKVSKINCNKICYLFATPYFDCLLYDKLRYKMVGDALIKNTYLNFNIPFKEEGFDEIKIIWNYCKGDFEIVNCLAELDNIDHGNPDYSLSIGEHMDKCLSELEEITSHDNNYENLYAVAQMHDIGKAFTKKYDSEKGYFTYDRHHLVSAYDSLFYLKTSGYKDSEILEMSNLIQWHMMLSFINTDKDRNKFKKLVGEKTYNNLLLLDEANSKSK